MRRPIAAGNWKMHCTLAEGRALVAGIREGLEKRPALTAGADVLIFPPATLLFPMAKAVAGSPIRLGGQNAHFEPKGAFTGEVSIPMLKDTGCTHVLVGHSERRHVFGETADMLARKVRAAVAAGMTAVYCVGEKLDQRESGQSEAVIQRQLDEGLGAGVDPARIVIAYEPVWAIGTGRNATPDQAQQMHAFIRGHLGEVYNAGVAEQMQILYGGSVKPDNATVLMAGPDLDGVLVGGACLDAGSFLAIIAAVAGERSIR